MARILFGEWTPDQPNLFGTVSDAKNVYPVTNGYAPMRVAADYSNAAPADLLVSFAGKSSGATSLFAASATQLYKFNSSTLNLDALTTSGYTATTSWDITQFGSKMIVANGINILQAYDLGGSTQFANLSASAPPARYVTVVRDFVVGANVAGAENKVLWSDLNDETNWTPSTASQADSQFLPDGGDITGLAGGEFGLVFLERAIYRMTYAGSPLFFQFDAISRTLGCASNGSIAQFGGLTYFLADDGFYVCDGQSTKPIGAEKVNRWFFSNAIPGRIKTSMSATVDPVNKLIVWCFENIFGGRNLLIYNININRFSYAETDVSGVSFALAPSVSLEQLDNYSASIDALQTSLDSDVWAGGTLLFTGVRGAKIVTFSGAKATATVATNDINEGRTVMKLARPIVDNGSGSVAVASRDLLSDVPEFGVSVAADSEGRVPLRSAGRYHRLKVTPTGANWSTVVGVDFDIAPQGAR